MSCYPITFALLTLGCKVNQYESQIIRENFLEAGCTEVLLEQNPQVVIINSCTVTARSDQKTRKLARGIREKNPGCLIVVTGCYAQRDSDALKQMPEINCVLLNTEKNKMVQKIYELLAQQPQTESLFHPRPDLLFIQETVHELYEHTRAFVKIQDGCNAFCSYCIIPYIRSTLMSKAPEIVVQEVQNFIAQGIKEIVLVGIHLGQYGRETNTGWNLVGILEKLVELPGDFRLRLSSLEMNEIQPPLLDLMAKNSQRLVPHIHIPLQGGEDTILARMNRHYTTAQFYEACEKVRENLDNPAISTDVIVGFPGETEAQFMATLTFCAKVGFSKMHIFPYSDRPRTAASQMPDKIPEDVKHRRTQLLIEVGQQSTKNYLQKFLYRQVRVLAEHEEEQGVMSGLTDHYVRVLFPGNIQQSGQFLQINVQAIKDDELCGIVI